MRVRKSRNVSGSSRIPNIFLQERGECKDEGDEAYYLLLASPGGRGTFARTVGRSLSGNQELAGRSRAS